MILFVANALICGFSMNCLVLKSITNNKYNEYNYNPGAIKFKSIFAWLLFIVYI